MGKLDREEREAELRMWIAVRSDIPFSPGKLAAQAGHAVCQTILMAAVENIATVSAYMEASQGKITVAAKSEAELVRIFEEARAAGIPAALITDAGRTEFDGPTRTTACFGPWRKSELPPFLNRLQLYSGHKPRPVAGESAGQGPGTSEPHGSSGELQ